MKTYFEHNAKFQAYRMANAGMISWEDVGVYAQILYQEGLAAFMLPQLKGV